MVHLPPGVQWNTISRTGGIRSKRQPFEGFGDAWHRNFYNGTRGGFLRASLKIRIQKGVQKSALRNSPQCAFLYPKERKRMEQEPSSIRSTRLGNNPIAVRQPSCQCTGFD